VPDDLEILIEDNAILGDWMLWINGREVPIAAFQARVYNGADKAAARVASYFGRGENVLAIRVQNAPAMGGLRTPLHLLGTFALGGENRRTLIVQPATAPFNDLARAGFPHFSGEATYTRGMDLSGARSLELPDGFVDVAAMRVENRELGVRAWSPYRWNLPSDGATLNGLVSVEIAVTNTLLGFVEGQEWNAETGTARAV
jgi:hypothetical protein